jgi:hypothetical protein
MTAAILPTGVVALSQLEQLYVNDNALLEGQPSPDGFWMLTNYFSTRIDITNNEYYWRDTGNFVPGSNESLGHLGIFLLDSKMECVREAAHEKTHKDTDNFLVTV